MNRRKLFVFCGPTGFAGASRIMCIAASAVASLSIETVFVGAEVPYHFDSCGQKIQYVWNRSPITSGAIGRTAAVRSVDVLSVFELAEEIEAVVRERYTKRDFCFVWAHYLFPYGAAAVLAVKRLKSTGVQASLWLTPAGSDIWEIGIQLPGAVRSILEFGDADRVLTYSQTFAVEIADNFDITQQIDVFKPAVERHFQPCRDGDRSAIRRSLGLDDEDIVFSSHSNMRPVKAPEHCIDLSLRLGSLMPDKRLVLLLIGPTPEGRGSASNVRILRTGVIRNVHQVLPAVDWEINLSRHDSFNLSLAEAMACGVATISTDVVGISTDLSRSASCVLTGLSHELDPRRRYQDAALRVVTISRDISLLRKFQLRAANYASQMFGFERLAEDLRRLMA